MKKLLFTILIALTTQAAIAQLAAPTFSQGTGTYTPATYTTINLPSGATGCFTTDGTTPTASPAGTCGASPTQTYTVGLNIYSTQTIKAISTQVGQTNSAVASVTYTIPIPTIVQTKGVDCSAGCTNVTITPTSAWTAGNMIAVSISTTAYPWNVAISCGGVALNTSSHTYSGASPGTKFADIRFAMQIPAGSSCTITSPSWTGAANFYEIANANATDSFCDAYNSPGCISASITGTTTGASTGTFNVGQPNELGLGVLSGYPSTPTFTAPISNIDYSAANTSFNSASITNTDIGTSITYGATWVSGSSMPAGAFMTIWNTSMPNTVAPVFSPIGGKYGATKTVSIVSPTVGSSVYYSTIGTATCGTSTPYTAPITVSSTTTISAISCAAGYNSQSNVQTYNITGRTATQIWYIRPNGGTRLSTDMPSGQCNGMYDVDYSAGVSPNCAFNDFRYLYDSRGYNNSSWVIQGGDTVIVRGCASGPNSVAPNCRIGWDSPGDGGTWCIGGGDGGCQPPIPSGTSSQHTRILGQNYAACVIPTTTTAGNTSQLFGGFGLYTTLPLFGAQYVDVQCLELTSHINCHEFGDTGGGPISLQGCDRSPSSTQPDYVDYSTVTGNDTHDVLLQDIWMHGNANLGVRGPIGGTITATNVSIGYNGMGGWWTDDGNSTQNINGVLNWNYVTLEWNGCVQQYPIVNTIPALYCFDQGTGGNGDGYGTQAPAIMDFTCNHCIARYNMQDAWDNGHVSNSAMSWINSIAYGNEGGSYKSGNNQSYTMINDISIGNCNRTASPMPGAPSTYNLYLTTQCRAAGDQNSFNWDRIANPTATTTIEFSTFSGYGATIIDNQFASGVGPCPGCVFTFRNNVILGYANTNYNASQAPGMWNSFVPTTQDHNLFFGTRYCVAVSGDISSTCALSPLLINQPVNPITAEAQMDNFNYAPTASSPLVAAGATISGVTLDYAGTTRPNPPGVGAREYVVPVLQTITVTPSSGTVTVGATTSFNAACVYSDSTTTPCTVAWTDTGVHSSVGSSTGVVTGSSIGSDTVTATISTVFGTATVTVVAPPPFVKLQGIILQGKTN